MSPHEMPSTSPNRMRVRSPVNESERDTMTTPSASIPTNSRPIAVSPDRRDRRRTMLTPPIITAAPTSAPPMPGSPSSSAPAMPGSTPWASASPMNASPRRTTNVPTMAQAIATRQPAISARSMNVVVGEGVDQRSQPRALAGLRGAGRPGRRRSQRAMPRIIVK